MNYPDFGDFERAVTSASNIRPDFSNAGVLVPGSYFSAPTEQDLRGVLGALAYYRNSFRIPQSVVEDIDKQVAHELQHGEAIHLVGAVSLGFGVSVFNNPETGNPIFIPHHHFKGARSVLARAAITLFPENLNVTDINDAASIGYTVERVVQEAEYSNGEHGTTIPIPLSLNHKNRTTIS